MEPTVHINSNACHRLSCGVKAFLPNFDSTVTRKALLLHGAHSRTAQAKHQQTVRVFAASQQRAVRTRAATQSAGLATPLEQLQDWLNDSGGSADALNLAYAKCVAARKLRQGQVVLKIPGDAAVAQADVTAFAACSQLAEGRSELVGLALWLASQRSQAVQPQWQLLVNSLPQKVDTPVLWPPNEQTELLQGSAALQEAQSRMQALDAEWQSIAEQMNATSQDPTQGAITKEAFFQAMSVVIAHATYLPSAQCFALLPIASTLARTGADTACALDYDLEQGCVTLTAQRTLRQGEEVAIYDGRPTTEMLLATGAVEESNPSDYLTVQAGLVASDRLYMMKKQACSQGMCLTLARYGHHVANLAFVTLTTKACGDFVNFRNHTGTLDCAFHHLIVQSLGFEAANQEFPIYADRMPTQLLAYLRLARLQDSGEIAKVDFEEDQVITPANEYEVLQLLMADMRDRLTAYSGSIEDELKLLQRKNLSSRQRVAAQTRLSEKIVLQKTLDAVRRRLAPIRGIPTKGGKMKNPNADLEDIFSTLENIPNAPKKLFAGIRSWARGEQDPTWKK